MIEKHYKKTMVQDADVQLKLLRLFNDLSYDLKFIDEKSYLLTSQMFVNIYLNELDQFCKHKLYIKKYIRILDDIIILWPDKRELEGILDEISWFLDEEFSFRVFHDDNNS